MLCFAGMGMVEANDAGEAFTKEERHAARFQPRRLIFNNDGNDIVVDNLGPVRFPKEVITSAEALLARRTTPLKETQVDAIAYCTTVGTFGAFIHKTEVGETFIKQEGTYEFNPVSGFLKQGTDPLRIMAEYCRANGTQLFWSLRMNDTHDASEAHQALFFSRFKREHPGVLFGTRENPPGIGLWSAVDYGEPEVRDFVRQVVAEVVENYEVDGVELDFWRHPVFFKRSGAGLPLRQNDLDAMSSMIAGIRRKLDEEGARRGRYLLLAIKVPDSVAYCKAIGLDIGHWMESGWVDLLIPGGYFQLSRWSESVALGKQYGIPVYACLPESRVRDPQGNRERSTPEALRARALTAWQAGVHGIEMFNYFDVSSPLWRELGSPELLKTLPKTYFVSAQGVPRFGGGFQPYVPSDAFDTLPCLSPNHPEELKPGESKSYTLDIGDDLREEKTLEAALRIRFIGPASALEVKWGDTSLKMTRSSRTSLHGSIEDDLITPHLHRITLSLPETAAGPSVEIHDISLEITKKKP